ncbi:MAG: xanthine dehydrogenase family protein molybdopterin-binding subunit [Chloroflexi bacterium]|nr:MAG: xanthine dehydrogenase family protein molybdopterin-binding subunit [Chloroflexota bacterium]
MRESHKTIGKSVIRRDALGKVTGQTLYPGDRNQTDELWLKILFADRVHARVKSINTSRAKALPGVLDVLTAEDVPVNQYGLQVPDQPVLCGPNSNKKGGDIVRFVGDNVAVVIAESEEIAAKARDLIEVEYEELRPVTDPVEAMSGKAPQLHPNVQNNIAEYYRVRTGNTDDAWSQCNVIIEGVYQTPYQEHAYLQPEAGTAYLDNQGRITVHCAGQWTWEDQQQIAHALDVPPERVRVVYDAIGGAFGGREDMSVQIILALAVLRTFERYNNRRPVKIIWTRQESIIGHCKRHPMLLYAKWGAKSDGTLLAAETKIIADGGAYMYTSNKVLGNTTMTCNGPYHFPNVKTDAYVVYTNNIPGGAFRGFGGPQGHFAAEMQMNKLAEKLGMDPVELRLKNALDEDKLLPVGTTIPGGVSIKEVIRRTAWESNWAYSGQRGENNPDNPEPLPRFVKGHGFAAGYKNIGFSFGYQENSWAAVELRGKANIEEAVLRIAGADVGQGHHTAMAQIAAETLGINVEQVTLETSDTAFTQSSGSASASRLTFMAGNAVKEAAAFALHKWQNEERPAVAEATWLAPKTTPLHPETGYSVPNFAYGYVAQMVEVTVDTETGAITVDRVVCADDVGQAINPDQIVGQIEGCVVQAHGYAVLEDFRTEKGKILTPHFSTYLIPGVYDIPKRVDSIIVEDPHPNGPYGVRGMAEMPYLPYAPAVVSAVFDAIGIWFDEFPLTPERVLRGLGKVRSRV